MTRVQGFESLGLISAAPRFEFSSNSTSGLVYKQEIINAAKVAVISVVLRDRKGTDRDNRSPVEKRRGPDRDSWIHFLVGGYTELSAITGKAEGVSLEPIS
jgi:hypothetical protein